MKITIRRATVDDAADIADVINCVIAEGKYTIFDKPFSEEQERRFISSLGSPSEIFVAETEGKVAGIQVLDLFSDLPTSSMSHVATMGTWLRSEVRGSGIGRRLAEESFRFARDHAYRKIVRPPPAGLEEPINSNTNIPIAHPQLGLPSLFRDRPELPLAVTTASAEETNP
jgi:L-amino acid N-acyltransferase YncA